MIIKKYVGKTQEEAIETAKKELGDSIVTMNVKDVKPKGIFGFLRSKQVEVTVALEEESESLGRVVKSVSAIAKTSADAGAKELDGKAQRGSLMSSSENIERKLDSLQNLLENRLGQEKTEIVADTGEAETGTKEEKITREEEEQDKFEKLLYNTLINNEVDEKYVNQIYAEVEKGAKPGMSMDYFLAGIYQKMILRFGKSEGIHGAEEGPKVILFIGPTGVGKTTTIAKIAGAFAVEEKKKVALVTADTYRIAAAEQLKTYAGIMEVPFRVVYTEEELTAAVKDFAEYDYIFVDTAGHSHQNEERLGDMKRLLEALPEDTEYQCFLVLSATTKYKDLIHIVDTYKHISQYELIFTKLDETDTYGNLLNIKLLTDTPIAYVTSGQNVPNDIEVFDPQKTVKLLLGGKR